eukprot:scaffold203_cov98-Skeletonema_dohrnii-CCMP3373.AAC.3
MSVVRPHSVLSTGQYLYLSPIATHVDVEVGALMFFLSVRPCSQEAPTADSKNLPSIGPTQIDRGRDVKHKKNIIRSLDVENLESGNE